jgi:hypothetical protein
MHKNKGVKTRQLDDGIGDTLVVALAVLKIAGVKLGPFVRGTGARSGAAAIVMTAAAKKRRRRRSTSLGTDRSPSQINLSQPAASRQVYFAS